MTSDASTPNLSALAERWWMLVARGVAAILFGVLAVVAPGISLPTLVALWSVYALVDGVFNLATAAWAARAGRSWRWMVVEGGASTVAGMVTFVWVGITAHALSMVIAAWGLSTGIAATVAAVELRRQVRGEQLLLASGLLSVAFGALLLVSPDAGALALVWMIGAYAIVFGTLLSGLGLRLALWRRSSDRRIPPGGTPTPA